MVYTLFKKINRPTYLLIADVHVCENFCLPNCFLVYSVAETYDNVDSKSDESIVIHDTHNPAVKVSCRYELVVRIDRIHFRPSVPTNKPLRHHDII